MKDFFTSTEEIRQKLTLYLRKQENALSPLVWSHDVFERIALFCQQGKAVRGNGITFIGKENPSVTREDLISVGSAIELFHAGILMQDDVTDNDLLRRGKPSIFAQYIPNLPSRHLAESFAFYIGDICFFLSYHLIVSTTLAEQVKNHLIALFAQESVKLGFGQLQDVYVPGGIPTEDMVIETYRIKTARYTYSLPFLMGAYIANFSEPLQRSLEIFGEHMGIIFQLQDDTIGLFGSEEEIGKPVGSDIREGKYTLHMRMLLEKAHIHDKESIQKILGNPQAGPQDISVIQEMMHTYAIQHNIDMRMQEEAHLAREILGASSLPEEMKHTLEELLDYNLTRTH